MSLIKNISIATVLGLFAVNANAGMHGDGHHGDKKKGDHGSMMEKYDSDKSGSVSKEEFTAHAEKKFMKMDTDGNGEISKEEYKAKHEKKGGKY